MPNTPLTQQSGRLLVRLIIIGMLVQMLFVFYVFYQSYEGRADLVTSQRNGCDRGKKDRAANASGWHIAEKARRAEGQIKVANHYRQIALGLEIRSRIDCTKAFPKAGIFP